MRKHAVGETEQTVRAHGSATSFNDKTKGDAPVLQDTVTKELASTSCLILPTRPDANRRTHCHPQGYTGDAGCATHRIERTACPS